MIFVNEVMILGRMGAKPTAHNLANGSPMITFSICTNEKGKDGNEIANWHNCEAWGNIATIIDRINPAQGQEVLIKGKLKNTSWTDPQTKLTKYKTSVLVLDFKAFPILAHQTAQTKNENFR